MSQVVEFYFDFGSPTTYLAYKKLPDIVARAGADIRWRPVLLGGVFKEAVNQSPVTVPAKAAWMFKDLARWATLYNAPMRFNPHFPINTLTHMRGAAAYLGEPGFPRYVEAMFHAVWRDERNLADEAEIDAVVAEAGFDGRDFRARIADPAVKALLKDETEAAVARGVFGAPTFFIGETMYFGQDRLGFVAEDLGVPLVG